MGSVSLILHFSNTADFLSPPQWHRSPPRLGLNLCLEPLITEHPSLVRRFTDRRQIPLGHPATKQIPAEFRGQYTYFMLDRTTALSRIAAASHCPPYCLLMAGFSHSNYLDECPLPRYSPNSVLSHQHSIYQRVAKNDCLQAYFSSPGRCHQRLVFI